MAKTKAIVCLGAGLALIMLLGTGCRDIRDEEEEPPHFTFVMDTPPDGASDVDPRVLMHWTVWIDSQPADSADLYFGTQPNPPFCKKFTAQDGGYYRPGPLEPNTTYYWRLNVTSPAGSSPVQSFSVTRDRTVWTYTLPPGQSVYDVNGTPEVLGNRVYQQSEKAAFHCLDAATGDLLWTYPPQAGQASGNKPAAASERVCFAEGNIYCLNAASGALLWSAAPKNSQLGFRNPLLRGDRVFAFTHERISCLDAANGVEIWGSDRAKCMSLCVDGGRVIVATQDAGATNFLECLDAGTGAPVWKRDFGAATAPSRPAAGGDRVFVGHDRRLFCLDALDGTTIWEAQSGEYAENPYVFYGKVLLATGQDRYALLDAGNGNSLWQTELPKIPGSDHYTRMNGDPVVVNNFLVLADTSGFVYAINVATGKIYWKYFVSTDLMGVACCGDRIYVTGDDEYLYCLDTQ